MPRLTVDLPAETINDIKELMSHAEISATETVRRAVAHYAFLDSAAKEGKGLQITDSIWTLVDDMQIVVQANRRYFRLDDDTLVYARTEDEIVIDLMA